MKKELEILKKTDFILKYLKNLNTGEILLEEKKEDIFHSKIYAHLLKIACRQHFQGLIKSDKNYLNFQDLFGLSFCMMYFKKKEYLLILCAEGR